MPVDTPFSISFTFPFFLSTFPQHLVSSYTKLVQKYVKIYVSEILAKKPPPTFGDDIKRESLRADADVAFPDFK